jgi:hypothetical protein
MLVLTLRCQNSVASAVCKIPCCEWAALYCALLLLYYSSGCFGLAAFRFTIVVVFCCQRINSIRKLESTNV